MRSFHATSLLGAVLASLAAADFDVYFVQDLSVAAGAPGLGGDQTVATEIQIFHGDPSCDDANGSTVLPIFGDASSAQSARCDGCDQDDLPDLDITELELNAGGDWGHYTIYKDSGYQLTPADGGPLRGHCVKDTSDDYVCTTGLSTLHGYKQFHCISDIVGGP